MEAMPGCWRVLEGVSKNNVIFKNILEVRTMVPVLSSIIFTRFCTNIDEHIEEKQ